MKLFKSKSKRENILNLIREFFNSEECSLNHGTDKIESDIESLKVRVHRLECSASIANNVDTFEDKTKSELNDCIKAYELKTSRLQAENKSLLNVIERQIQEISELQMQLKNKEK